MRIHKNVEKLFQPHSSEPRNPGIANVFFKGGYIESWGRGYKSITDICKERRAVLPVPEENSGGLVVECLPSEEYLLAEKNKGKIDPVHVPNVPENEENSPELPRNCPKTVQRLPKDCPDDVHSSCIEISQELHRDCIETAQKMHRDCPKVAQRTYEYLCNSPAATINEMSQSLGISVRTVNNHLSILKKLGFIERVGSDAKGHWKILDGDLN